MHWQNLLEIESAAKTKLKAKVYDFFAGGSGEEMTLGRNRSAYQRFWLVPRVLTGINLVKTETSILGSALSMPIIGAPSAFQCLAHQEGEIAVASALAQMGLIFTCSTLSTISLEEVAKKTSGRQWFQLYIYKDRTITMDLIRRAEQAGYQAIMLTVDVPIMAYRQRDQRNQFCLPKNVGPANLEKYRVGQQILCAKESHSTIKSFTDAAFDEKLTWKDIDWLKSQTKLPVLIKGIIRNSDAIKAIDCGSDAIIISNHGGRQLDGVCSTIEILSSIAETVSNRVPVLLDGGIRSGLDMIKALALGADAVLLGRPLLWGLAVAGESGVMQVLQILKREFIEVMTLCGYESIDALKSDKGLIAFAS